MHHRWKYTSAEVPLWNGGGGAEAEIEKMLSLCCQNAHGVRKKLDHFCSYFSHIEFNKIEIFY